MNGSTSMATHAANGSPAPLEGRVALVTGASAGIGAEFARMLAARGAHVALVARRADRLHALADELQREHGVRTAVIAVDLASPAACERVLAACRDALGAPDILVNNAGYGPRGGMAESSWSDTRDFVEVMAVGYLELTLRALPAMRARGYGRIVQVSSLASFAPEQAGSLYGPAKRFVTSFSRALALELAGTGVHVCASCPGFTRTEFHDVMGNRSAMDRLPPWMWSTAAQVAQASWRAVDAGRAVVVPGAVNKLIALLCWLLPTWAVHAISPRSVRDRRAALGESQAAGATSGAADATGGSTRATGATGATSGSTRAPSGAATLLAACVCAWAALGGGACATKAGTPSAANAGAQPALSEGTRLMADELPLVYLNLAALVAQPQLGQQGAIAELGTLLPAVRAEVDARNAKGWPVARGRLLALGNELGGTLGVRSPGGSRNAGLLLPPDARVAWTMRAEPEPGIGGSTLATYRVAQGGSLRVELPGRTLAFPVRSGLLQIEGFEDATAGERIADLRTANLVLDTPSGTPIEMTLSRETTSHAVLLKSDRSGLVTAVFSLRSPDPDWQAYFGLFGPVRLTMDFVWKGGALDFGAAGAVPALIAAPTELPIEPGRDPCAEGAGAGPAAWSDAQRAIVQAYCGLRAELR